MLPALHKSLKLKRFSTAFFTQNGFSLVEVMVGIALGLFIVSGALTLYASQLRNSKRILADMKLHQELRLTSELISRQLRNSGYWSGALNGTVSGTDGSVPPQNAYANVTTLSDGSGIVFQQNFDADNIVNSAEILGFRLNNGIIQSQLGSNNWQDLTDPKSIQINAFVLTPHINVVSSTTASASFSPCSKICTDINTCPKISIRSYNILISAQAPSDSSIQRALEHTIKIRNDQISGVCPA